MYINASMHMAAVEKRCFAPGTCTQCYLGLFFQFPHQMKRDMFQLRNLSSTSRKNIGNEKNGVGMAK